MMRRRVICPVFFFSSKPDFISIYFLWTNSDIAKSICYGGSSDVRRKQVEGKRETARISGGRQEDLLTPKELCSGIHWLS